MNAKLGIFLLAFTLATAAHALEIVLPDACGSDKIKFDVETKKNQPPPAAPADGKARIVFIFTFSKVVATLGKAGTTRFGIDGTWAGAASQDSYFVVDVVPGEHNLCSAMQSQALTSKNFQKTTIGMSTFTAEAGKTYYFEFLLSQGVAHVSTGGTPGTAVSASTSFARLDDPQGKFRVKSSALSTSTAQK
jgi:hypothetical protein